MERTLFGTEDRKYLRTHPWITFQLDLRQIAPELWILLGECQSKCAHLAGVPLKPAVADKLHRLYLARGIQATTAIEGNTLSVEEVEKAVEGKLRVPESRQYLKDEVENIVEACHQIYQAVFKQGDTSLTVSKIKEFNKQVLRGLKLDEGVVPGETTIPVVVGDYRGAPREDCDYLLDKLTKWIAEIQELQFPEMNEVGWGLIRAVLAHLYIAWIHPFGDGNGRTSRLVEFQILLASGVPSPAAHLLSNHYNLTRTEYYDQLRAASKSGGDVRKFLLYALEGFRDGLREQLEKTREQQWGLAWESFVFDALRGEREEIRKRRRDIVMAISATKNRQSSVDVIAALTPALAKAYANKTDKTLTRDVNALVKLKLLKKEGKVVTARMDRILAFLPPRAIRSNTALPPAASESLPPADE